MDQSHLITRALEWAQCDVGLETAAEVRQLVERRDLEALGDRFARSLEFGTAGLRGLLGGGTNRMNRSTVISATAGLARYLKQHVPDGATRGVVVGRDARHQSDVFARDVAAVLTAEGIVAHVFHDVVPTPLAAFAVKQLNAAAGVMVTASHNPPAYNGYKVYWENGAQIIPPHDVGIAAEIEKITAANGVARLTEEQAILAGLFKYVSDEVERLYVSAILALRPTKLTKGVSIVYSAMHGVGGRIAVDALTQAGFSPVVVVTEQHEPNPDFPTVKFPNPEEKGAMALATAYAERDRSDLVLVNDPDADRLAVMARDAGGTLRMLSGNEVGLLLGHFLMSHAVVSKPLVVSTIVSSAQLGAIARSRGVRHEETLTGLKWVANRAIALSSEGYSLVLGFEEALGYCVGTVVADKDGISAALVVADMAAWCHSRGQTLLTYLEEIQRSHGIYLSHQFNATLPGAAGAQAIASLMDSLRRAALKQIGAKKVSARNDFLRRERMIADDVRPLEFPASNVLSWEFEDGGRIIARPSGTEPKIKFYFEVCETVRLGESFDEARARGSVKLQSIEQAFLNLARQNGLPQQGAAS